MKTMLPKTGLFIFTILLFLSDYCAFADKLTLNNYYPSVSGNYYQLQLPPRTADLSNPCVIGTLYVNSNQDLKYCNNIGGNGLWGSVSDYWTQEADNIYLTDSIDNPNLHVGIGTKTPDLKLTLLNDSGIIAKGTFGSGAVLPDNLGVGSRLIWYPAKAAFRAGALTKNATKNNWDDANIGNYSVAMGKDSLASGDFSVVGGGDSNTAKGSYSNVIGGQKNIALGDYSAISGGHQNAANGQYSIVTGGDTNIANANYTTVLGGQFNTAAAIYATVGGGVNNIVATSYSNINGGKDNSILDPGGGGATGYSVIGGGLNNTASNDFTVITGGESNTVIASYASIGGGQKNTCGYLDTAQTPPVLKGLYSRVSGGQNNFASADYATISGGQNNIASGISSTIGGGLFNTASGNYSVVGGGARNTASGDYSMIMGGSDNIAGGKYSWAEGRNMQLTADAARTFAWGYSDTPVSISTADAFIIAPGTIGSQPWNPKVGVRTVSPLAVLEINGNSTTDDYVNIKNTASGYTFIIKNNGYIGVNMPTPVDNTDAMEFGNTTNYACLTGGGQWLTPSSRKFKTNIQPLNLEEAQKALDELYPVTFNYKKTPDQKNAGFIAEDVPSIVAMKDRQSLSTMDIIAVLTKTAQNQEKQIKEQDNKIKKMQERLRALKKVLGE